MVFCHIWESLLATGVLGATIRTMEYATSLPGQTRPTSDRIETIGIGGTIDGHDGT